MSQPARASPKARFQPGDSKLLQEAQVEKLPKLTNGQWQFVEGVLEGKNLSEAYRTAYPRQAIGGQPRTIWRDASVLAANPKVVQWLEVVQTAKFRRGATTLDEHSAQCRRLREEALAMKAPGAAVAAEKQLAAVSGLTAEADNPTVQISINMHLPEPEPEGELDAEPSGPVIENEG